MTPRQLHFDKNYGIDRRRGSSAVVDGRVIVQFRPLWRALFAVVFGR
jgi:hypothetical protein